MKNYEDIDFILDFKNNNYPYLEEVNEGVLKQVGAQGNGASVLDVGAGRGALGEALCRLGYQVWVIESNQMAVKDAALRVDQVICADLHDMNTINEHLKNKKFKYIIFSDVLEHVFDPITVLRNYLPLLADEGKILISLPNAVNWLNRLCVMFGMFNYTMTGVMDRTHVRFFTFKSAKKMLTASQCVVEKVDSTPFLIRAFLPFIKLFLKQQNNAKCLVDSSYYQLYKKYIYPLEYRISRMFPSLLAFNIIIVARKNLK